jgi:hypothetical protein
MPAPPGSREADHNTPTNNPGQISIAPGQTDLHPEKSEKKTKLNNKQQQQQKTSSKEGGVP